MWTNLHPNEIQHEQWYNWFSSFTGAYTVCLLFICCDYKVNSWANRLKTMCEGCCVQRLNVSSTLLIQQREFHVDPPTMKVLQLSVTYRNMNGTAEHILSTTEHKNQHRSDRKEENENHVTQAAEEKRFADEEKKKSGGEVHKRTKREKCWSSRKRRGRQKQKVMNGWEDVLVKTNNRAESTF